MVLKLTCVGSDGRDWEKFCHRKCVKDEADLICVITGGCSGFVGHRWQQIMSAYLVIVMIFSHQTTRSTFKLTINFFREQVFSFTLFIHMWVLLDLCTYACIAIYMGTKPWKDTRLNDFNAETAEKWNTWEKNVHVCEQPSAIWNSRIFNFAMGLCYLYVFREWFILANGHGSPSIFRSGIHRSILKRQTKVYCFRVAVRWLLLPTSHSNSIPQTFTAYFVRRCPVSSVFNCPYTYIVHSVT